MKDVFWSLFGMASVAEVAGRGWHFSPYPIPFPFGEKSRIDALAVNSAAGNRSPLLSSFIPPSHLPAFSL